MSSRIEPTRPFAPRSTARAAAFADNVVRMLRTSWAGQRLNLSRDPRTVLAGQFVDLLGVVAGLVAFAAGRLPGLPLASQAPFGVTADITVAVGAEQRHVTAAGVVAEEVHHAGDLQTNRPVRVAGQQLDQFGHDRFVAGVPAENGVGDGRHQATALGARHALRRPGQKLAGLKQV